ncbi:TetR/AcrR family transcriptional regulator [Nonomuraea sp. NPDC050394]|uniref:TetR/AcrR family transcriptional regulator n=1 Tax=Nonomuraea sp. NPDC050394 TaxID=3364363 RepID=UPI00378BE5CE
MSADADEGSRSTPDAERAPGRRQANSKAKRGSKATQSRAATEAALMAAALRLLERDGVLAGLSLQAVADEAGVNRGLIHHYFGSRQALLRAALEARKNAGEVPFEQVREDAPADKEAWSFEAHARDSSYARVVALLALDGDEEFAPMPYVERRLADLRRESDEGRLPQDVDLAAILVMWDSFFYGYFVMRTALARQLGVTPEQLDQRVVGTYNRLTGRDHG